jgi:DNA-3-methyladenine glycosylase II
MFLMFSLGRRDVLAADDLGVQVGIQRLYALEGRPTPKQVHAIAEEGRWHPYATAACFQLWESLKNNPG